MEKSYKIKWIEGKGFESKKIGGNTMYEYKYVKVLLEGLFTTANHHEVINEHARNGWKLIQILPLYYNAHGKPNDFEAIFEREIKETE